ncbi:hypothetical protein D3C86_2177320 [compost metagenome]
MLRNGVTAMVATMMRARAPQSGRVLAVAESQLAMRSVPPELRSESDTGIRQASMIRIGASRAE